MTERDHTTSQDRLCGLFLTALMVKKFDDNFLIQVIEEGMKALVLLDFILANKEELVREVKIGVILGCSDRL
ncbi:hypothetical protein llap_7819 [Limosa lapponica baueri]|uniref:Uncharacterized protein n=1 Tax=Limosa lapponica baueri TaxID=1758121 RepID=A0A2I0U781_LIMLA|nr:hypothetical protein llap_7819 [Limosa lapponica baueri]